jgi:cation diffusion facilitator CzcD-associated flavoprotein CzcO
MNSEYFDVLIVGAGLSGIGAACRLQRECPDRSYVILERRDAMGGTWDLFRYPGIRSDSDMHTLGYDFKPWKADKAIADGPAILSYMQETAAENGIDQHIRYRHRVTDIAWSSSEGRWTVQAERGDRGEPVIIRAGFIFMCAGYYSYDKAHTPGFADQDKFRGQLVHPQFWPEELDYRGKRVVVIGSGATAMTLVPAMARDASQVTMLQRSPTYVVSRPDRDRIANLLRRLLPERWAYSITRWKNVLAQQWVYHRTRVAPQRVRSILLDRVRGELGPDYDVEKHFTPRYNPWDQRLCLIPNSDLFAAIRSGSVTVVTDQVERFAAQGIVLKSGKMIEADIIVSATGLELAILGEARVSVDGDAIDFSGTWSYKGVMYSGVPNLVTTFGYINASWTLRADLTAAYSCRLLNHMRKLGVTKVVPQLRPEDADMPERDWIEEFSAGYMRRAMHRLPRQGDREPWINPQNYRKDRVMFLTAPLDDGVLEFSTPDAAAEHAVGPLYSAAT